MENLKRIYVKLFEGTYKNGKFFGSIYKDEKKKKKKKKNFLYLNLKKKSYFNKNYRY